jgi:hypothetical protein
MYKMDWTSMKNRAISFFLLTAFVMLTACNFPLTQQAPQMSVETIVARTLTADAAATQNAIQQQPANNLPPIIESTLTVTATLNNTPTLTLTAFPTYTQYPTATQTPCNQASFVTDVSIPDNTHFNPSKTFTKTWRIKNTGSCTWTTSYKLVFDSGDSMGGPASISLPSSVAPNGTIDLSVDLTSPASPGTYIGNWKLMDQNGVRFGLGSTNKTFWVKIIVDAPFFAVTAANATTTVPNVVAVCPYTFTFTANVTVTAAGTVTYWWVFSDGTTSAPQSLTFSAAGTQAISTTLTLSTTSGGWVAVDIDNPNHQQFPSQVYTLTCTP